MPYRMSDKEIERIFLTNKSHHKGYISGKELTDLLNANNIDIPYSAVIQMYEMIDGHGTRSLSMASFHRFIHSKEVDSFFRKKI